MITKTYRVDYTLRTRDFARIWRRANFPFWLSTVLTVTRTITICWIYYGSGARTIRWRSMLLSISTRRGVLTTAENGSLPYWKRRIKWLRSWKMRRDSQRASTIFWAFCRELIWGDQAGHHVILQLTETDWTTYILTSWRLYTGRCPTIRKTSNSLVVLRTYNIRTRSA